MVFFYFLRRLYMALSRCKIIQELSKFMWELHQMEDELGEYSLYSRRSDVSLLRAGNV